MRTDSIIITVIAEVVITSETPSNHVTAPDHVSALVLQSHISFTRNQAIIPGTIVLGNKRRRRFILRPGTSIDSRISTPVTLIRALIVLTYNTLPKSKVNQTKAVKVMKTKIIWMVLLVLL
jgi:hypothetical protein